MYEKNVWNYKFMDEMNMLLNLMYFKAHIIHSKTMSMVPNLFAYMVHIKCPNKWWGPYFETERWINLVTDKIDKLIKFYMRNIILKSHLVDGITNYNQH